MAVRFFCGELKNISKNDLSASNSLIVLIDGCTFYPPSV